MYFRRSYLLCDNVEKYGGAREATNDTIWRLACWMLDKQGYTRCTLLHTPTRVVTRSRTHALAYTHTHTHTQKYCFSKGKKKRFCERAWMLMFTYLACLVLFVTMQSPSPQMSRIGWTLRTLLLSHCSPAVLRDHKSSNGVYRRCVSGRKLVDWIMALSPSIHTRQQAAGMWQALLEEGVIYHGNLSTVAQSSHRFCNKHHYFIKTIILRDSTIL
jgi:hypothetical protein